LLPRLTNSGVRSTDAPMTTVSIFISRLMSIVS
jgi:hypothetical protein